MKVKQELEVNSLLNYLKIFNMAGIDIRTIFLNYTLVNVVSLLIMIILWFQLRKRFDGIHYFILDFILQISNLLLIFLRGHIPDFFSMSVANTLSLLGTFMGLIGLAVFTGRKINYTVNIILIALFFAIHTWFSVFNENLAIRSYNFAFFFLLLTAQCAIISLYKVPAHLNNLTRWVGVVFLLFSIVNVVRLIVYLFLGIQTNDYLHAGPFETAVLLIYQILFTFLTFSLVLMFNRRLLLMINSEEEKFKKAFHLSPYVIIISRPNDGKILEVNKGFSLLTGYSGSEVLGKTTVELNFWEKLTDRSEVIELINREGRVLQKEYHFRKKSGEIVVGVFNSAIIEIYGENCMMSVIYDITERKNMETRLMELNATKDKFLSIIAHDLKSPLSNIFGFSNLIVEGEKLDAGEIHKYASLINKSAANTINLLENLLDWASIQDGRISFKPRLMNLNELLSEMVSMMGESAAEKKIEISLAESGEIRVKVDENMIKTVVRNLLSNAVKFTKPGGNIMVSAIMTDNGVVVKVTDSGVGISAENINKLFDIGSGYFTRGTKNEKGTGIGLLLCHEFIEKHSGKMIVESREGEGSTFGFSIPVS